MNSCPRIFSGLRWFLILGLTLVSACAGTGGAGGGGGGGGGTQSGGDCSGFGGSVNDNANVTYGCVDPAGALYEMKFDGNGGFVWYFITTGDPAVPNGQYSVVGDQVRLLIPGFDVGGADFDESSTAVLVKLGMLAGFTTPRLSCGALRHDFDRNDLVMADYSCDPISVGPDVAHFPVFRFAGLDATQNSPLFNQAQPGNAFWSTQKDIAGSISNEDYNGIYRQIGNKACMYFPGAPAGKQEVEAEFSADISTLVVDRPDFNGLGPCRRI